MTTWYSLKLADTDSSKKTLQRIMDAFTPKYVGAGQPLGMAVFSSYNSDISQTIIYFTPKAVSLAVQFGASPCSSDFVNTELSLLVGDESSIDFLFPDVDTQ